MHANGTVELFDSLEHPVRHTQDGRSLHAAD